MAEETFTQNDETRLQELLAKQARVRAREAELARASEREAFKPVNRLINKLNLEDVRPALDEALRAPELSEDVRARLQRLDQILRFDVESGLVRERDRLAAPATPDVATPAPAPTDETPADPAPEA